MTDDPRVPDAAGTISPAETRPRPHGREEVVESIIDATLSLWSAQGPAELSLRGIAARAGVNYGLVHRHFGSKEAVIRAAMNRVVGRSLDFVIESDDLVGAIDEILPPSTGAHARLLAWATLQYVLEDVLPEEDPFLMRLRALADEAGSGRTDADLTGADLTGTDLPESDRAEPGPAGTAPDGTGVAADGVSVGSLIALLYGWRLFEPYLVRGLRLQGTSQQEIDELIRRDMLKVIGMPDPATAGRARGNGTDGAQPRADDPTGGGVGEH
ncbi:helix-turn-helix domain-containing protein [Pseudonocardia dioxanivorans]|jgi:AcrR family transcriptional regulator|uniref:helix-turn-helix domain-containing protein n=1 Tax=Pseudonocardia dioxanivorans TaxID=240495 RepID=UPI0014054878|nr:TetR/AcrR family transcriptional regulator [Pseudonocardia dioxanivorans]